ncbi:hypothetical protein SDC9_157458 [bioreactor metagenome]|uniref:Uncharacterized protein n=1 Tax=bioreactor metagenome TaxID=1076179 RepID=A0A645FCR9_9ZZZZ
MTGNGDGGVTYYAKWTVGTGETLRTVRTTELDLRDQTSDEDKLSTEGWAWYFSPNPDLDYAAQTLVLSDMTLNTADAIALYVPDGTTIVLIENTINTVKSGDTTSDSEAVYVYGVYSPGVLTIRGNGTLNAIAGKAVSIEKRSESYGIFSRSMNIQDGTIIGNGGSDAGGSYGICSQTTMVISGGSSSSGPVNWGLFGG